MKLLFAACTSLFLKPIYNIYVYKYLFISYVLYIYIYSVQPKVEPARRIYRLVHTIHTCYVLYTHTHTHTHSVQPNVEHARRSKKIVNTAYIIKLITHHLLHITAGVGGLKPDKNILKKLSEVLVNRLISLCGS